MVENEKKTWIEMDPIQFFVTTDIEQIYVNNCKPYCPYIRYNWMPMYRSIPVYPCLFGFFLNLHAPEALASNKLNRYASKEPKLTNIY